jgi:hypothetical protein
VRAFGFSASLALHVAALAMLMLVRPSALAPDAAGSAEA